MIIRRVFRGLDRVLAAVSSKLRILRVRILYPGVKITGDTTMENGCKIAADDGSLIELHNCHIGGGVKIRASRGGTVKIHDSFIGWGSVIVACSRVEIGEGCWLAEYVVVRDQDHRFGEGLKLSDSGFVTMPIVIASNCWLGAKATVLKGVSIAQGTVVAANAVVTRSIEVSGVYGGVPAKRLRACGERSDPQVQP